MQPIHGSSHAAGATPVGGAHAAGKAVAGTANSSTTVSNIGELQKKAPEFVDGMLKTIAQNIMRMEERSQKRMKEILRDSRKP